MADPARVDLNGNAQLPWGTAAWLPEDSEKLRQCEWELREIFVAAGAGEIVTPAFEYAEVLERGFGHPEKLFRFLDPDGKTLALRPELTTPAARLFATALRDRPLPVKLFYIGPVYRQEAKHRGMFREFRQAGFECYGGDRRRSDLECLQLAAAALVKAGARDAVLEIGTVAVVDALLAGTPPQARPAIKDALARRDRNALAAAGASEVLGQLLSLPSDQDGLSAARDLVKAVPGAAAAIDELAAVAADCAALPVRTVLELAAVRPIDYYTGIVFEGLLPSVGRPVLSGGRYDRLVEQFGAPCPATGFSIEIETLLKR